MKVYVRLLVLFAPRVKFYSERGDTASPGGESVILTLQLRRDNLIMI